MLSKSTLAAAGLRPGELAHLTGVHPTTVSRWLSGELEAPRYAITIVAMWQKLTEPDRRELLLAV
jgi:DNA-binding transcriptional regulator YdaS (Cro superfamily)